MNPIALLRRAGQIEAISFLLLVGVAMPLKYLAGMPLAVEVVGWMHGLLFVLFGLALLRVWIAARWPFGRVVLVFIAALLPFGPFAVDRRMRAWELEFARRES